MTSSRRSFLSALGLAGGALVSGRSALAAFSRLSGSCSRSGATPFQERDNPPVCPPGCTGTWPNCDCTKQGVDWGAMSNWIANSTPFNNTFNNHVARMQALGPIWNKWVAGGKISANDWSAVASQWSTAASYLGSSKSEYFSTLTLTTMPNTPPATKTVLFANMGSSQLKQVLASLTYYGVNMSLAELTSFAYDPSCGTKTPSAGLTLVLDDDEGCTYQNGADGVDNSNSSGCQEAADVEELGGAVAAVAGGALLIPGLGELASVVLAGIAAGAALDIGIAYAYRKIENC